LPSEAQILVTGEKFTGHGLRAIQPVMEELIESAEFEIQVIAYVLSPFAIGFLDLLKHALERGVSVSLIVNRLGDQPSQIRDRLAELKARFSCFTVKSFDKTDHIIHAKALVVDRREAVIGSANFTWGGLVSNHEICVLVKGEAASRVGTLLDGIGYES
jgi:phosphatidylserine/phosphatidylglycerophosphate/cardiolipin synthase-like enzyme